METHVLSTSGAEIAYDVYGPLPPADGHPVLLMIGQPMDASGFRSLAARFDDRTVVAYDPRGLGRSTRSDGLDDHVPATQAEDLHALIAELGAGPVDVFGSSGGAIAGLALVTAYPDDVVTLVAHEPPIVGVLPDAEATQRAAKQFRDAYQAKGWGARHGGLHGPGDVAGRVHRRVLRPAGARPRDVRHADRGRRVPGRPAAVRARPRRHRLRARRRRPHRGVDPRRPRRRRGDHRDVHRADVGGHGRAPRPGARGLPEPSRRLRSTASSASPASPTSSPSSLREVLDGAVVR